MAGLGPQWALVPSENLWDFFFRNDYFNTYEEISESARYFMRCYILRKPEFEYKLKKDFVRFQVC